MDRGQQEALNDLNASSKSMDSLYDNNLAPVEKDEEQFVNKDSEDTQPKTKEPEKGDSDSTVQLRQKNAKTKRRRTLSVYEKDLEEARKQLADRIESKVETTDKNSSSKENVNKKSVPEEQEVVNTPNLRKESKGTKSSNIYAKYVQEGNRNLMLITEPLEVTSKTCYKQIGNKNVLVHLNVSSNLCQLIDLENEGVIPLDSKGEVWLDIKVRDKSFSDISSESKSSTSSNFSSSSNYKQRAQNPDQDINESVDRQNHRQSAQENDESLLNNLDDVLSANDINQQYPRQEFEVPFCGNNFEDTTKRRSATEHLDSCDTNLLEDTEAIYRSFYVKQEHPSSLQIIFEKGTDYRSPESSVCPLLKHQKVIEFLTNHGNCFDVQEYDVSICDWEYETSSVYQDYVRIAGINRNNDYDLVREAVPFNWEPTSDELYASTFGFSVTENLLSYENSYSSIPNPNDEEDWYSLPDKATHLYSVPTNDPQCSLASEKQPPSPPPPRLQKISNITVADCNSAVVNSLTVPLAQNPPLKEDIDGNLSTGKPLSTKRPIPRMRPTDNTGRQCGTTRELQLGSQVQRQEGNKEERQQRLTVESSEEHYSRQNRSLNEIHQQMPYDLSSDLHPMRQGRVERDRHQTLPVESNSDYLPGQRINRTPMDSPIKSLPPCRQIRAEDKKTPDTHNTELSARPLLPLPPSNRNQQDDLLRYAWYHGNVEKAVARRRLLGKPHGSFIVRKPIGQKPSHMFTIDLIDEGTIKKLMILQTMGQYHFNEFERQKRFASLEDLVQTIMTLGLEVRDGKTNQWKTISVTPIWRE